MSDQTNTDADESIDPLDQAAAEPQAASIDGQSVTNRSITELIEADRYQQRKKARGRAGFGIGLARHRPPSAVGE